ncbi:ABC transporter substrate-binding protein [Gracilibacillus alcaliphilus]|uniref:ABC transporter substrate-binding protein n=1 Tax=Gracilibacillus alcaliphilus TaxID=1401441 RepID=UPI00195A9294|nr:ABC transporter substrate-binding protein [Gracilibacillus alcaliphilus]MBM7675622.1 raffinose/stachyose/melibiose transport system substrate-binding protein [Gracilibacillus alcaliphilus]
MEALKTGKWLALAVIGLFVLLLAACGSDDTSSSDNGSDQVGGTVSILISGSQRASASVEAVAEGVKEKYNIDTEIEVRPEGAEGDNVVKTRLATGEMTDIMSYNSGALFKALNPSQHFADLSDEPYMDTIQEEFKVAVSDGDGIYGVPGGSTSSGGILYNKAVYEELGLEVPQTWEEFLDNNDKIKAEGKVPVVAAYQETWTSQVILLGDYYNLHAAEPDFGEKYTANEMKYSSTPAALRGLEKIAELHEHGHYNDAASSTSYTNGLEMLATGEAVHFPVITDALAEIESNHPDQVDDIGFFAIPNDDPEIHGMTIWLPGGFYVNKDAQDLDAAKRWVEYATSPEGIEKQMEAIKPNGPYMVEGVELPDDTYEAVLDMNEYVEAGNVTSALEFSSPLKGPNLEQITVELGLGMVDPAEAAEKYDRDVERQALQLDLEGW